MLAKTFPSMSWAKSSLLVFPSPDARREAEKLSFLTVSKLKNITQSILNYFLYFSYTHTHMCTKHIHTENYLPLLVIWSSTCRLLSRIHETHVHNHMHTIHYTNQQLLTFTFLLFLQLLHVAFADCQSLLQGAEPLLSDYKLCGLT